MTSGLGASAGSSCSVPQQGTALYNIDPRCQTYSLWAGSYLWSHLTWPVGCWTDPMCRPQLYTLHVVHGLDSCSPLPGPLGMTRAPPVREGLGRGHWNKGPLFVVGQGSGNGWLGDWGIGRGFLYLHAKDNWVCLQGSLIWMFRQGSSCWYGELAFLSFGVVVWEITRFLFWGGGQGLSVYCKPLRWDINLIKKNKTYIYTYIGKHTTF